MSEFWGTKKSAQHVFKKKHKTMIIGKKKSQTVAPERSDIFTEYKT